MANQFESTLNQKRLPQIFDETTLTCRRCGVIGEARITPGKGPHFAALACDACGSFIRWLPCPPTDAQIRYLKILGYDGAPPSSKRNASRLIDSILRAKEVGRG